MFIVQATADHIFQVTTLFDLYRQFYEQSPDAAVAESLMNKARDDSELSGAKRMDLLTGVDNRAGQALYEKLGFVRSLDDFIGYSLGV